MGNNPDSIEDSVVKAMDGSSSELFPFLPYILQDLWEMGTSSEIVISLVEKHCENYVNLKILDLGCGKGAVAIELARKFACHCVGIDGVKDFIEDARNKAEEFNVENYCKFECDDIRVRLSALKEFDIVILGAIGPVLGDYDATLNKVSKCIKPSGLIIIDDGYIAEGCGDDSLQSKAEIIAQVSAAGMELVDEIIMDRSEIERFDNYVFTKIESRCRELIAQNPDKRQIIEDYIRQQEEENEVLESKMICSIFVIAKKGL